MHLNAWYGLCHDTFILRYVFHYTSPYQQLPLAENYKPAVLSVLTCESQLSEQLFHRM